MYSFEPTEEQQMLVEAVGKFALKDLRVMAHEAEEGGGLPKKLISKGWEIGLLQASIPEAYGGFGERSAVTGVLAVEEMASGDLAGALRITPSLLRHQSCSKVAKSKAGISAQSHRRRMNPYTAALIEYAFDFDPNA
jgi:alkylation response protein AidB-like acyl-CoA dehydrogenase